MASAEAANEEDLRRIHPASYLNKFKRLLEAGGGELSLRIPFGSGAFEITALSASLVKQAVLSVLHGHATNAYALSRPPGHHCLPDFPNGFCLMANIPIAIEAARKLDLVERVAVVDWDVHHGNGTEAFCYNDPNKLIIFIHQERCYPQDSSDIEKSGGEKAPSYNIPLPPGGGHATYLEVRERLVLPKLRVFNPNLVVIACGYATAHGDPLSRMMSSSETFRIMTPMVMAETDGKLVAAHEDGYSKVYVTFCGHAVLEEMSSVSNKIVDPMLEHINKQ